MWYFQDGVLTATEDERETLWTKEEDVEVHHRLGVQNAPGTNSGVFVYGGDFRDKYWIPNSIEVQILDDYSPHWAKVPKTWLRASSDAWLPKRAWSSRPANGTG